MREHLTQIPLLHISYSGQSSSSIHPVSPVQSSIDVEPTGDVIPLGQGVQIVLFDTVLLYVPASHGIQALLLSLYPLLHRQKLVPVLPTLRVVVCARQSVHKEQEVAPAPE